MHLGHRRADLHERRTYPSRHVSQAHYTLRHTVDEYPRVAEASDLCIVRVRTSHSDRASTPPYTSPYRLSALSGSVLLQCSRR
jgi:hypothetical protein